MAKRNDASALIVALSMEFLAVGIFTVIAGTDENLGNVVLLFVVGLAVLFLINNAKIVSGLANAVTMLAQNPGNI